MDEPQETYYRNIARRLAKWMMLKIFYAPLAEKAIRFMPSLGGDLVLIDLGTGTGLLSLELGKLLPQARVIGVDPDAKVLEIARRNASETGISNFETKLGSAEKIPINSDSVDMVVTRSSFHEWENPKAGLSEVIRILRPGGCLMLKDFNREWLSGWKCNIFILFPQKEKFITVQEVVDLLKNAGFEKISVLAKGLHLLIKANKPQTSLFE